MPESSRQIRQVRLGTEFCSLHSNSQVVVIDVHPTHVEASNILQDPEGLKLAPSGGMPYDQIGEIGRVWSFEEVLAGLQRGYGTKVTGSVLEKLRARLNEPPVDVDKRVREIGPSPKRIPGPRWVG